MRLDKIFACAAVLGCASAVKLDTTSALEAEALAEWGPSPLGPDAYYFLDNMLNADHAAEFREAATKCQMTWGDDAECQEMNDDLKRYREIEFNVR